MLAQQWLYGRRMTSRYDATVERHLAIPTTFNPHSSVAVLNQIAERIVFTDDVPSLLYEMHENKQLTYEGILTSARLPYDCFWIEYKSRIGVEGITDLADASYGALVKRMPNGNVRFHVIIGTRYHDLGVLSSIAYVVDFDHWPPKLTSVLGRVSKAMQFYIVDAYNRERLTNDEDAQDSVGGIVCELIFGIFLVTQPKVYSDEAVVWHPRKQAARRKSDKPPLLEYRRIRLKITKPVKRYTAGDRATASRGIRTLQGEDVGTETEDAINHRRYHKVMGHFRHYLRHDPPYTVWIDPHYRGDPALGITFTERDVTK